MASLNKNIEKSVILYNKNIEENAVSNYNIIEIKEGFNMQIALSTGYSCGKYM